MDSGKAKKILAAHPRMVRWGLKLLNHGSWKNTLRVSGVTLREGACLLRGVRIESRGMDNVVEIRDFARLRNCVIHIEGSHNHLVIGEYDCLEGVEFWMEDDGNQICLGAHTAIHSGTQLAAIEGTKITFGDGCLVSNEVCIRTGDSHSILDAEEKRINPSRDVVLEEKVWLGNRTMCLKGSYVSRDSIVAAGAVVTKAFHEPGCILAGLPAKVVKQGVHWDAQRVTVEKM